MVVKPTCVRYQKEGEQHRQVPGGRELNHEFRSEVVSNAQEREKRTNFLNRQSRSVRQGR